MKLIEAMKTTGIEHEEASRRILRKFPEDCEVIVKSYRNGELIFQENAPLVYVGILLEGRFSCHWEYTGRDDYAHISKTVPIMLGDQAAIGKIPHYTGTFRAAGKCKVALLRLPDFWRWMEKDPAYYQDIAAQHIRMLLLQCRTRRSSASEPSNIRVMKYLTWYCRVNNGENLPEIPVTVSVTREEMTDAIGRISLRTVNRILAGMEQDAVISIIKGKIRISPEQYLKMSDLIETYAEEQ